MLSDLAKCLLQDEKLDQQTLLVQVNLSQRTGTVGVAKVHWIENVYSHGKQTHEKCFS